jgi:hypothetical protein
MAQGSHIKLRSSNLTISAPGYEVGTQGVRRVRREAATVYMDKLPLAKSAIAKCPYLYERRLRQQRSWSLI